MPSTKLRKAIAPCLVAATFGASAAAEAQAPVYGAGAGPFASIDVLWLKPYDTEGQTNANFDTATVPRYTLGYALPGGTRLQARYFKYDKDSRDNSSLYTGFRMTTLDLEAASPIAVGNFSGLLSIGLRTTSYREDYDLNTPDFEKVSRGYGLVAGVELHREIFKNFSMFGVGRGSINRTGKRVTETGFVLGRNYTYTIWDLQVGAEYRWPLGNDWTAFFRVSADAQYWGGIGDDDTEDVSLMGWGFTIGIR